MFWTREFADDVDDVQFLENLFTLRVRPSGHRDDITVSNLAVHTELYLHMADR